jgi:hypothetical protein
MNRSQHLAWLIGCLAGGVFLILCSRWKDLFDDPESRWPMIVLVSACWLIVGGATYVAARDREMHRVAEARRKEEKDSKP